jgi:hypothetical protein
LMVMLGYRRRAPQCPDSYPPDLLCDGQGIEWKKGEAEGE